MESGAVDLPSEENAGHPKSGKAWIREQYRKENSDGHDQEEPKCQWADCSYWVVWVDKREWWLNRTVEEANDSNRQETPGSVRTVLHIQWGKEQIDIKADNLHDAYVQEQVFNLPLMIFLFLFFYLILHLHLLIDVYGLDLRRWLTNARSMCSQISGIFEMRIRIRM